MILHIDSDASYLSEVWAHSRTGGHYYLISLPSDPPEAPNIQPPENGPIHTECRILKHVVASADEAEVGGLFHNGKPAVLLCITLHDLGFPHPKQQTQSKQITPWPKASSPLHLDKNIQGNEHAILLDERQSKAKRPFRLLETSKPKHEGLIHETSPTTSP